jgi:hypothetical protein
MQFHFLDVVYTPYIIPYKYNIEIIFVLHNHY